MTHPSDDVCTALTQSSCLKEVVDSGGGNASKYSSSITASYKTKRQKRHFSLYITLPSYIIITCSKRNKSQLVSHTADMPFSARCFSKLLRRKSPFNKKSKGTGVSNGNKENMCIKKTSYLTYCRVHKCISSTSLLSFKRSHCGPTTSSLAPLTGHLKEQLLNYHSRCTLLHSYHISSLSSLRQTGECDTIHKHTHVYKCPTCSKKMIDNFTKRKSP